MKNNKVIHARIPETLYETISDIAGREGITISDYFRNQLSQSIKIENPLHSADLLFVFAYIESNGDSCKDVCGYEVKHIINVINRHYQNLEPELQLVFDEVITKMNRFLKKVNLFGFNEELILCFGEDEDSINFDFQTFYKCTDGRLPYR